MQEDTIEYEYFNWMYHLVCNGFTYNRLSYKKLLYLLYNIEFYPYLEMDENVMSNALDFRKRFAYDCGYSVDTVEKELCEKPCSILEIMVSLSFYVEESIMTDPDYGNRTGQWFWNMIVSLDLGSMDDKNYDEGYIMFVIDNFIKRNYMPNGHGGLFTFVEPREDMTKVDIWKQCMWYLNEFI